MLNMIKFEIFDFLSCSAFFQLATYGMFSLFSSCFFYFQFESEIPLFLLLLGVVINEYLGTLTGLSPVSFIQLLFLQSQQQFLQHYILLLMMKLSICGLLCVLLLSSSVLAQNSELTTLTYYVQYEEQQEEDFIQVQLEIQSQSPQLTLALNEAKKIATQVAALADQYCKQYIKKGKGDCKEAVDVGNFEIEPQYQKVRKENVFTAFVVSHQVKINVYSPENIGYLIDNFLKFEDLTIKGFEWLPLEEKDSQEEAVQQGLQEGQNLCKQIGQSLGRIVDIEEVLNEQQEQEKKEEEQEQEEQEPEITTYKFQVECVQKAKSKK